MIEILSHRGYWQSPSERNTEVAFSRSFAMGYGIETDIRDCNQKCVIAHDMALGCEMDLPCFLDLACKYAVSAKTPLTIALNIKADGLAGVVGQAMALHPSINYFVFDMSVPDMRSYIAAGIPVFTRMSEVEKHPVWLDTCSGVWLDGFDTEWYDANIITDLLRRGKRVCVVSPELHNRDERGVWTMLRRLQSQSGLSLCTDYPEKASAYFWV